LTTWAVTGWVSVAFLLSAILWRLAASLCRANDGPNCKEVMPMKQPALVTFASCLFNSMATLTTGLASGCLLLGGQKLHHATSARRWAEGTTRMGLRPSDEVKRSRVETL